MWPLKLRLRTKQGVDERLELLERTKTIKVPTDFFKLNADTSGFYRVLYSPKRLQTLGQNVRANFLSPEDKIGLLSDALTMAGSGYSTTSSVLALLENFDDESNYFVWKEALRTLEVILQSWDFEEKPVKDGLKALRLRLVRKTLDKQGWDFKDSDENVEQMFKALIFSNGGGDPKVIKAAHDMFEAFLAGDSKAINANIQDAVFKIALEHGGAKEV